MNPDRGRCDVDAVIAFTTNELGVDHPALQRIRDAVETVGDKYDLVVHLAAIALAERDLKWVAPVDMMAEAWSTRASAINVWSKNLWVAHPIGGRRKKVQQIVDKAIRVM